MLEERAEGAEQRQLITVLRHVVSGRIVLTLARQVSCKLHGETSVS
jgi:hypothetical protein